MYFMPFVLVRSEIHYPDNRLLKHCVLRSHQQKARIPYVTLPVAIDAHSALASTMFKMLFSNTASRE